MDDAICPRTGSSPHTRGARHERPRRRRHRRIIPAYAGSTARISPCFDWGRGSSPHTRGALERGIVRPLMIRIIPAYAGSTPAVACPAPADGDHPRIRGEHRGRDGGSGRAGGSSPHTRGARDDSPQKRAGRRIIPAYAGSTGNSPPAAGRRSDHPRIRGEHASVAKRMSPVLGSSPHTRGARSGGGPLLLGRGIIPAYAGSTQKTRGSGKCR